MVQDRLDGQAFTIDSDVPWLGHIPGKIEEIFVGRLLDNGVYNEVHNKYKRRLLRKDKLVETKHVGVWGWNSWCGVHTFPILTSGTLHDIYKATVDVGFSNTEEGTGLLPHAVLHENGFASTPTFKCYGGAHGEAYNLDNIMCWAKMAMEYYLASGDTRWFEAKFGTIKATIDYILDNLRDKYNPKLIYTGVEGDWTECTDWEMDNANVNVNMVRTLELFTESAKLLGKHDVTNDYLSVRDELITHVNKPVEEGGFWSEDLGYYIHGNNGDGTIVHGDRYFESTANYFALLWSIVPEDRLAVLWQSIDARHEPLEMPYPVLTNLHPRTGARRKNYGATVTNGDVWMVLGAHAAATRLQGGYRKIGTAMFKAIVKYEMREGVLHNCIYPKTGGVNKSWDPEIANYGALFAPITLGILGINYHSEGLEFNLVPLEGMQRLKVTLYFTGKTIKLDVKWDSTGQLQAGSNMVVGEGAGKEKVLSIHQGEFILSRTELSLQSK